MLRGIELLAEPDSFFEKLSSETQDIAVSELETALNALGIEIEDREQLRCSSWVYFIYLDRSSATIQSLIKLKHPARLLYAGGAIGATPLMESDMELFLWSGLLERTLWPDLITDSNVFFGVNCNHDVNGAVIGTPFEASLALYGGPIIGSYEFMPLEGFGYGWDGVDENATLLGGDWIDINFSEKSALASLKYAREADIGYEDGTLEQRVTSILAQGTASEFSNYVKQINVSIYETCLETWGDATNFDEPQGWANYYGQTHVLHLDRIKQFPWSKLEAESRGEIIKVLSVYIELEGVPDLLAAIAYNPHSTTLELSKLKELEVDVVDAALIAREMPKNIFPRLELSLPFN